MKSMTGYGRAHTVKENIDCEIEIKSVNSRYLDLKVYLPRDLNFFETEIRKNLNLYLNRGSVDVRVTLNDYREACITLNKANLMKYADIFKQAQELLGDTSPVPIPYLLDESGVLETQGKLAEDPVLAQILDENLHSALKALTASLYKEANDIKTLLQDSMILIRSSLDNVSDQILPFKNELLKNMNTRINELLNAYKIDNMEQRIVQELAIYIDKYDVKEELTRLESHISTLLLTLNKPEKEDIGKTLNFILQEMQREANTLGSKFSNTKTFQDVLIIKEEIEKCREIVQNVA